MTDVTQIRNLEQKPGGPLGRSYWTARLILDDGSTLEVHRMFGSWQATDSAGDLRGVRLDVATELAERVKTRERQARRAENRELVAEEAVAA